MRGLILSALWLLCKSTDKECTFSITPTKPPQGLRFHPIIMSPHSSAWLMGLSVILMMINLFNNQLGRYNLAVQLAQPEMISLSIFQQITGFSGKAVLIRIANQVTGWADIYKWRL